MLGLILVEGDPPIVTSLAYAGRLANSGAAPSIVDSQRQYELPTAAVDITG